MIKQLYDNAYVRPFIRFLKPRIYKKRKKICQLGYSTKNEKRKRSKMQDEMQLQAMPYVKREGNSLSDKRKRNRYN